MEVEDYAQGTEGDSICAALEQGSPDLGRMAAWSARIHQIWKDRTSGQWQFPKQYKTVDDAWTTLRAGFVAAFEAAQAGDYATIDKLPAFKSSRATVQKALSVYFPDRFLPIATTSHLRFFVERVFRQDWTKKLGGLGFAELNRALFERLRQIPELAPLHPLQQTRMLYAWSKPVVDHKVLKISPGELAKFWDQCREAGNIQVGWEGTGDLRSFKSKHAFKKVFQVHYPGEPKTVGRKVNEVWSLLDAGPGTTIVANRGLTEVVGVGTVTDDGYVFEPDIEYGHTLRVAWEPRLSGSIPKQAYWQFVTVHTIEPRSWDIVLAPLVGASPPRSRTRRDWIFQANVAQYDLAGAVAALKQIDWRVSQHADEIGIGDRVFLWESGAEGGVRAVATVCSDVAHLPYSHDDEAFVRQMEPEDRPAVVLSIDRVLQPHLTRAKIKGETALAGLSILKNARGTNFKVTRPEAKALQSLIDSITPAPSETMPAKTPFQSLLDALDAKGLYFPSETVANFLLALQTKRFVILTGISGTGKTELAKEVAARFPLRVAARAPTPPAMEDVVALKVHPSNLKYNRFVVPRALADLVPALMHGATERRIKVHWPGGTIALTLSRGPTAVQILFRGEFRKWIHREVQLGDTLYVAPTDLEDDIPTALRIFHPGSTPTTEPVDNVCVVPVRPDWTDNRGLLGYWNPLTGRYVDTPFLRLLLAAQAECERAGTEQEPHPFFAILDEMNLARVEHYFSDFLSTLESGKPLPLHQSDELELGAIEGLPEIPKELVVPKNLHFIGTVNVDETTYMFSPKVLDRAFTIEFNDVDLAGLAGEGEAPTPLVLDGWPGTLAPRRKPRSEHWKALGGSKTSEHRDLVIRLHALLEEENRHFGYRVANEIAAFVLLAIEQAPDDGAGQASLDLALLQKVLPKLSGTQQEIGVLTDRLYRFALGDEGDQPLDRWTRLRDGAWTCGDEPAAPPLPRTARKLRRMRRRLRETGFAAYVD